MERINPWALPRLPLAEDYRIYRDPRRPGVEFPLRLRELDGAFGEEKAVAEYRRLCDLYLPKDEPKQNGAPAAAVPVEKVPGMRSGSLDPAASHLPPDVVAGILAGAAKGAGRTVYACPDGSVVELTERLIGHLAQLVSQQVPEEGQEPADEAWFLGIAARCKPAWDEMIAVSQWLFAGGAGPRPPLTAARSPEAATETETAQTESPTEPSPASSAPPSAMGSPIPSGSSTSPDASAMAYASYMSWPAGSAAKE